MAALSRVPAVAGAALVLLWLGGASPAAAQDAPEAVTTWFAQEAPAVAGDVLQGRAVDIADASSPASTFTVGDPVALHRWSDGFVDGESVEPLVASGEWVAPLSRDGVVVGTIAATESAGAVAFAYVDDDAQAGRALTQAPTGDVVQDPQLGGLVEVGQDGDVDALSRAAAAPLAGVEDATDLQSAVEAAHDPGIQTLAADGAAGGPAGGVGAREATGLVLLVAGAAALARRRLSARSR
ncbi:hypothetical protein H9657_10155 [Cellulomonas sp. Sa3CUA2]|uniref:Gram-positive cocci surface proteins LPxTG domain-containing protein n=1 Tax=Cellulomonas avistercoris TaxID=2762242 RepID=A0ABR8QDX2_9CELL|nr:hypothetical protein [Cellulomonas avistercoris]MBD7918634.1 hypothetical protein [Cellulomonas avistercoris]